MGGMPILSRDDHSKFSQKKKRKKKSARVALKKIPTRAVHRKQFYFLGWPHQYAPYCGP